MRGRTGPRCSLFSALLVLSGTQSFAQSDPLALQRQAIRRMEGFVETFRKTGDIQSTMGDLSQADQELTLSNRMLEARGAWEPLALGLIKQGSVRRMQTNWAAAGALYKRAGDAARRAGNVAYQADALAWGALVESSLGNIGQALADATQAVRLAETVNDNDVLARALNVLGTAQVAQRDLAGAAATINREVAVARESKDPMTAYLAYSNRHGIFVATAEKCDYQWEFEPCYQAINLAKADLREMLSIARRLGFSGIARITEGLAGSLQNREALIKARERGRQSLQKANLFRPRKPGDVLVTEGFVPPPGPEPPMLTALYEESKRIQRRFPGYSDAAEARSEYLEGLAHEMRGNNDAALDHFMKAVGRLERDRSALRDERSRGTVLEDRIGIYYAPMLQLLQRRRYSEAFELLERSRSRAMAEMLASRNPGLARPREQQLYSEVVTLRARISSSQSQLFRVIAAPDFERHTERITMLQGQIRALEADHRKLVGRIGSEAPHLLNLVVSEPASLESLQKSMREERYEVIQYLVLEPGIVVWHITSDSVYVRNVFLPRDEVTAKVAALRKNLADGRAVRAAFDETTARELFLFLVQPVLGRIRAERLVIVPHEDLGSIPFQALQDPSNGQFLGERIQISYAPSATVLLALKRPPSISGGRLLAIADPTIREAPAEVRTIAKLFPGGGKTVTDELAKESDVKAWIDGSDVIHLSVHGKFDGADPLLSYLQMAPGGGDDGKLTAAEMFGLPLDRSRLVVLSACETGRAEATHANEILGMVRALLYAGAGRLVLSYWEVDSAATALWMRTFYEVAQTKSPPEAARAALTRVKGTPGYGHPYYWAAFMMVGR
ncbi:MAG: CHAT domain-containing protein [Bryobacteraceae bacterium]